jgi:hypothetical protein
MIVVRNVGQFSKDLILVHIFLQETLVTYIIINTFPCTMKLTHYLQLLTPKLQWCGMVRDYHFYRHRA